MDRDKKIVVDIDKLMAEGREAEADTVLRRVLRERPLDVEALVHSARLAARRRDFRQSQELAARALGQAPAHAGASLALADALLNLGWPREAIVHFRKAEALRPDIRVTKLGIGRALADLGHVAEAAAVFDELFDRNPDLVERCGEMAAAGLAHAGDLAGAARLFERGAELPGLRYQRDACVHAVKLIEKARTLPPDGGIVAALVAWGESYIDPWIGLGLPSLLHPTNFPALAARFPLRVRIFTDRAGKRRMESEGAIRRLAHFATVDYEVMPDELIAGHAGAAAAQRYLLFALMHHVALYEAIARQADYLALFPDMVVGKGSYTYVADLAAADRHDALVIQSLVGRSVDLAAKFSGLLRNQELGLTHGQLIDAVFATMHRRAGDAMIRADGNKVPREPGILAFADPTGIRLRMFQSMPMWISRRVLKREVRFKHSTPDDELVARLFPRPENWSRILIPETYEGYSLIGLENSIEETTDVAVSVDDVAKAVAQAARQHRYLDPFRRWILGHEIMLRGDKPPPWADAPDPGPLIASVVAAIERAATEP